MLYFLFILGALIVLLLLIAFIEKNEYSILSEIVIDKEKDVIFNYIIHLKNQEQYNKQIVTDSNVKITYTCTDGTVGFTSAWESGKRNIGGEQEITATMP